MKTPFKNKTLHLGIAEKGKILTLDGNYPLALHYFREAIRLCSEGEGADVFFQHYSQCVMEVLEHMSAYDEVLDYCDKVVHHLDVKVQSDFSNKLLASTLERAGIQCLYLGDVDSARVYFDSAQKRIGKGRLPITDRLLFWLIRGYAITKKQIVDLQKKNGYFVIDKSKLRPDIAIDLPSHNAPF